MFPQLRRADPVSECQSIFASRTREMKIRQNTLSTENRVSRSEGLQMEGEFDAQKETQVINY